MARPLQEATVDLLGSPAWPRHLTALLRALRERRDTLVVALASELPELELTQVPDGGLHLWLRLPAGLDDIEFADRARRDRVLIEPGRPYFVTEPPTAWICLTYGRTTPTDLTEGVRRLAAL